MPSRLSAPGLYVPFLIAGMLVTGCSNSLWTKWQDMQCVENCDDPNPAKHVLFEQPVWQTLQMFVGELGCFLPVIYTWLRNRNAPPQLPLDEDEEVEEPKGEQLRGWSILLLWLPAAFDLTGTTLMNVGLLYTPVSIYQMTRGALVLWVGLFSVMFLQRKLWLYQWLALLTVVLGVSIVGLSGSLVKKAISSTPEDVGEAADEITEAAKVIVGILFILFAQLFTAAQFVIEEKIMAKYSVAPLVAVGYEGFFGLSTVLLSIPILTQFKDKSTFFDISRGWTQMTGNSNVLYSSIAIAFSIAFFNAFGLSVTRHVSATARSTADTCRTLGIWIISLLLGWEILLWPFSVLQVVGFGFLVYGTFVFNNLVAPPTFVKPSVEPALPGGDPEEQRALLVGRHLDETAALPADLGTSGYDVVPPPRTG
ncbi:hypothetical protein BOTBODRAFT_67501 [Botryobasidium botryosum FD-172 SS1]|uniref:EamA domain-containing protein n=1 Tax=Botryobasidium botryosum (strain FD-172 SS1) TaxID=930990 RepID=A0A067M966_BOTB1|nr:hypothetical protein BOTBODRAFT_67501 [Botryobasidium botryosum FD-172 SS1]